jgi:uncharacterized protein YuzE
MASMTLSRDYDHDADVLYLTLSNSAGPSECEDRSDGITVRYSVDDMRPIGIIVVGYEQYGWAARGSHLASIVGNILDIPENDVKRALPH